jgi:hypothetical protein
MAESCPSTIDSSSMIDDNKSVQVFNAENSTSDEKIDVTISVNGKRNKRQMTLEEYRQLTDKLLEIEQIKCEEYLVYEKLNRLNAEKQHLQNLLNILHIIDLNDGMKNSRCCQRRLQKN